MLKGTARATRDAETAKGKKARSTKALLAIAAKKDREQFMLSIFFIFFCYSLIFFNSVFISFMRLVVSG